MAGGALAAVLVGVVVVAVASGGGDEAPVTRAGSPVGRPADSGRSPASYSSSPTTGAYAGIAQRGADARPLTEGESFPSSARTLTVTEAGARLRLVGHRLDTDCANAVWGVALGEELRRGGCTQALRGMYADARKGLALSVTVLNLNSSADADRLVAALGNGRGGGFVRPLTEGLTPVTASPKATSTAKTTASPTAVPLERFGEGFSMARGLAMGHYAVIAWAQRLDGTGDPGDEALLALLIEGGKAPGVLGRAAAAG